MHTKLAAAWTWLTRTARLAVGVPDYVDYVAHMRRAHPDRAPMSREDFARERMEARYGRGRSRCC
ncbi:MAG: YbdD/YjiX family protein [Pseudomonadota bacterium]